jgi:hypothetical protein
MLVIDEIDEADQDWDWFAVDPEGRLGHFTTAGQIPLPETVKQDKEAALRLIEYFFKEAPKNFSYTVRPKNEFGPEGWEEEADRDRYLSDFVAMASTGLFSYNRRLHSYSEDYFLVAAPNEPLLADQLPPEIRDLVK